MRKQERIFSRRRILGMDLNFILRSRILAGIAALLMGASIIFSPRVSAHNIDLEAAREKARDYARSIRNHPGRTYKHYATDCVRAFSGHNHYVRCTIYFQNAEDRERGEWTCKEQIEVYLDAHRGGGVWGTSEKTQNPTMHIKRTSQRAC